MEYNFNGDIYRKLLDRNHAAFGKRPKFHFSFIAQNISYFVAVQLSNTNDETFHKALFTILKILAIKRT